MKNIRVVYVCPRVVVFALATFTLAFGQAAKPSANPAATGAQATKPTSSSTVTTSGGAVGTIPEFHTSTDIENSPIVDSSGNIGIAVPLTAESMNGILVNGLDSARNLLLETASC
jgi:hypothetical protein